MWGSSGSENCWVRLGSCLALVHVELTVDALDVGVVTKAHHVVGVTRDPSDILLRSSFVRAAVWPLLVIPEPPTTPGWNSASYALWGFCSAALSPVDFRKVPVAEAGTNRSRFCNW